MSIVLAPSPAAYRSNTWMRTTWNSVMPQRGSIYEGRASTGKVALSCQAPSDLDNPCSTCLPWDRRPGAVPEFKVEAVARGSSVARREADEVAAHLATLCHLLVCGEAPPTLAPHLAGAALLTLPQVEWRRSTHSCGRFCAAGWWASCCVRACDKRPATSSGRCRLPSGAEAAVHCARQWLHRTSDHVTLIDFTPFNAVSRQASRS